MASNLIAMACNLLAMPKIEDTLQRKLETLSRSMALAPQDKLQSL